MAVTVSVDFNTNVTGNRRQVFGLLFLNEYVTGGVDFNPAAMGLAVLDRLELDAGRLIADGSAAFVPRLRMSPFDDGINPPTPDIFPMRADWGPGTPGLMQAYWCAGAGAALAEVGNGEDLSGYIVHFTAWGV